MVEGVDVGAEGAPEGGVGGAEEDEGGECEEAGQVGGAGVVAEEKGGVAQFVQQIKKGGGTAEVGDVREGVDLRGGPAVEFGFAEEDFDGVIGGAEEADEGEEVLGGPAFGGRAGAGMDHDRA